MEVSPCKEATVRLPNIDPATHEIGSRIRAQKQWKLSGSPAQDSKMTVLGARMRENSVAVIAFLLPYVKRDMTLYTMMRLNG